MAVKKRTQPAKQAKAKRQGTMKPVPESRARRERLEVKKQPRTIPKADSGGEMGGSRSMRASASRSGRQPVLESPGEHPAGKGPPLPKREALREEAKASWMKPGPARRRTMPKDEEE